MNFIVFVTLFLIIISTVQIVEVFLLEKNKIQSKKYAKWSIFAFGSSYFLLIICTALEYFIVKRKISPIITILGFSLIILRFFIKYWSVKSLGNYWSSHVRIMNNHKLVKKGPYSLIRHPVYLARIINIIGIPLITNSYYTLCIFLPINLLLVFFRIYTEEKLLIEKFGKEYIKYKNETGSLIPLLHTHERRN